MCQPPASMVKDYNWMLTDTAGDKVHWMLTDTAGDRVPDQSNPKVIIVDEPPEGDEASHCDRLLGNHFTGPGDMVASPYGHGLQTIPGVVVMVMLKRKSSVPWSKP